jgi:hypothetical protein
LKLLTLFFSFAIFASQFIILNKITRILIVFNTLNQYSDFTKHLFFFKHIAAYTAILGMRLSVAFRKRKFLSPSLKATASQRIEISRKEQKEQKNNKCQPHQKFIIVYWSLIRAEMLKGQYWPVIPDRSLTGSGIQGNSLKSSNAFIARLACAP